MPDPGADNAKKNQIKIKVKNLTGIKIFLFGQLLTSLIPPSPLELSECLSLSVMKKKIRLHNYELYNPCL